MRLIKESPSTKFQRKKNQITSGSSPVVLAAVVVAPVSADPPRAGRADVHVLSYNQQSLWFMQKMDPARVDYVVHFVARVVDAFEAAGIETIVVVTGHEATRIETALASHRLRIVHNPSHAEGMGSSIARGIAALGDCAAAFIALGDLPLPDALANLQKTAPKYFNSTELDASVPSQDPNVWI